jgi:hypothetical protein
MVTKPRCFGLARTFNILRWHIKMNDKERLADRDTILFGNAINWQSRSEPPGIAKSFSGLDTEGIRKLIRLGVLNLADTMNSESERGRFFEICRNNERAGFSLLLRGICFRPQRICGCRSRARSNLPKRRSFAAGRA